MNISTSKRKKKKKKREFFSIASQIIVERISSTALENHNM